MLNTNTQRNNLTIITMHADIDIRVNDKRWDDQLKAVETLIHNTIEETLEAAYTRSETPELSIVLTGDAEIRELNKSYRGKDKATNVLSFPLIDFTSPTFGPQETALGDLVLSFDTIEKEAKEQNKSFAHHLQHLLVHGCLHLLGYDHEEDQEAATMEALEAEILATFGIKNPYDVA